MGRKFGFSFSWKRALGISGAKSRISRKIGIPLTRSGRQRKVGRAAGCFVATVAFGSYDSPEVKFLRAFRDEVLCKCLPGRVFIRLYYTVGPSLALLVKHSSILRKMARTLLSALIRIIEHRFDPEPTA
ncbi:MAG TPA: hypothetical protein P5175_06180 [Anaerohalosphaeraceae bacterium]|nr:hypothetical protein [Anaerohalosphaeraceae bacterium]